jgi:hypothetical protein
VGVSAGSRAGDAAFDLFVAEELRVRFSIVLKYGGGRRAAHFWPQINVAETRGYPVLSGFCLFLAPPFLVRCWALHHAQ